jgi:uncharacterized membrane protein YebE (DUF533 family)
MSMEHIEILRAACCVAGLDLKVTGYERKLLEKLAERAGVGGASLDAMLHRATKDPDFYQEQFSIVQTDPDTSIKTLFLAAIVDGELSGDERMVLAEFAHRLGMAPQRFDQILAAAKKELAKRWPGKETEGT